MKTILSTLFSLVFICSAFAQIGNKPLGNKMAYKDLGSVILVKPSNVKLKDVGLPRSFNPSKTSRLEVPQAKLKLPSRKKVKITPISPYNPNLEFSFDGMYSKYYLMVSSTYRGGLITFNAQRGKEYRMKVALTDKKHLIEEFNADFPNGEVGINIGSPDNWHIVTVNQSQRQFTIVFTAAQSGQLQIAFNGIFTPNWKWGDELWLPIKSIEIDEI
tara:strand:- start:2669 stop:3316 length:648 start_codon:yes stop_codon:yes gene_type:complete